MTTTAQLRDLTVAALTGHTDAGTNVWSVRSWPTQKASYPMLYVHAPTEERQSLGDIGAPQFTVTATIRIMARVQCPTVPNDVASFQAVQALEALKQQIDQAVINEPHLMPLLQHYPFTRCDMNVTSDAAQTLGEMQFDIGMEFYQGPEDFYDEPGTALEQLTLTADLTNVVDRTGTYAAPPFPDAVTPAPRTTGPDGRPEGGVDLSLPP